MMMRVVMMRMRRMTINGDDEEEGEDNDAQGTLELSKVRSLIRMQPMKTLMMMMMKRKLMLRDMFRYDI